METVRLSSSGMFPVYRLGLRHLLTFYRRGGCRRGGHDLLFLGRSNAGPPTEAHSLGVHSPVTTPRPEPCPKDGLPRFLQHRPIADAKLSRPNPQAKSLPRGPLPPTAAEHAALMSARAAQPGSLEAPIPIRQASAPR